VLLTAKQKIVYRMVRKQGIPQKDVAEQLKLSEPAISRLLSRADLRINDLVQQCAGGPGCELLDAVLN
jgi:DNA-binding CsgD family transcriptional regulator